MKVWVLYSVESSIYGPEHNVYVAQKVFSTEQAVYEYMKNRHWKWDCEEFTVDE